MFILSVLVLSVWGRDAKLVYVIDGDTAVFKFKSSAGSIKRVCRFAYIDAPESKRNKKATKDVVDCPNVSIDDIVDSGRLARRYVKSIMPKGKIYSIDIIGNDRYGRAICVIDDINYKIVRNGFAVPFYKYIKRRRVRTQMSKIADYAKDRSKGLWRSNKNVIDCMSRKR